MNLNWHKNLLKKSPPKAGPLKILTFELNLDRNSNFSQKNHKGEAIELIDQRSLTTIETTLEKIGKTSLKSFLNKQLVIEWTGADPMSMGIPFFELAFKKIDQFAIAKNLKVVHVLKTPLRTLDERWLVFLKSHNIYIELLVGFIKPLPLATESFGKPERHESAKAPKDTYRELLNLIMIFQEQNLPFSLKYRFSDHFMLTPHQFFSLIEESRCQKAQLIFEANFSRLADEFPKNDGPKKGEKNTDDQFEIEMIVKAFTLKYFDYRHVTKSAVPVSPFQDIDNAIRGWNFKNQTNAAEARPPSPFSTLKVNRQGDISTLMIETDPSMSPQISFGNVFRDSFEEILRGESLNNIYSQIQEGMKACQRRCPYYSICGGGLPNKKYEEHQSFTVTETKYCRWNNQMPIEAVLAHFEGLTFK